MYDDDAAVTTTDLGSDQATHQLDSARQGHGVRCDELSRVEKVAPRPTPFGPYVSGSPEPALSWVSVIACRYLADHIPGARYLEVDAADHWPWLTDPDKILTGIEEFLTGSHAAPAQSHRALRTVLFTDIVASTQHAAVTGDERWRAVLQRFGEITADLTERFGGTVVKSTGDGHLTTFDGPTQAIRCAEALRTEAETLGVEIRAGIHTGECELLDADIGGSPCTSRRGSSARPAPAKSWSPAPSVTWSWLGHGLRGPRQRRVAWCARQLATAGGRPRRRAGRISRGRTGVNTHVQPSHRDAPIGSRR